jgi:acetyl esterase/lipase
MTSKKQADAEAFYATDLYKNMRHRYSVAIETETLDGVDCEWFTPVDGIAEDNKQRIVINLHGGGFVSGERTLSQLESIPIAALMRVPVVSIDYRQGPDYHFPAATEDIVAVYQSLLQDHEPAAIGLYGYSAGATLAAQTIARLQEQGLPLPGAVVMAGSAAGRWDVGDSWLQSHIDGKSIVPTVENNLYFRGIVGKTVAIDDPLLFQLNAPDIMSAFPPTWLASSTRDFALSSVLLTHTQLDQLGVETELHIWEGMDHGFVYDAELPEAQDYYQRLVRFLRKKLLPIPAYT